MNQLPHSLEAEDAVLGAVLLNPSMLAEVAALTAPQDFYGPTNRNAYAAMLELANAQRPVDCVTVAEVMAVNGQKPPDLERLFLEAATPSSAPYHAKIIRRKAERRRTILALRELAAAGLADVGDEEYREEVAAGVLKLLEAPTENRAVLLKPVLKEALENVEKRYAQKSSVTGIATGYPEVDGMLAGLQPGELVLIAARPSMGKSALAFNVVTNTAQQGVASLVYSLEMSRTSVGERMLSGDGPIDGMRLRSGRLETRDWVALSKSASRLAPLPVTIDDSGTLTIAEIRARTRRWAATNTGRRLVVLDYLQLVSNEQKKNANREQEVSGISRGLKQLAKELNCPVVALSQLNRDLEKRGDKRPIASDLRESGSLEQDADVIMFVYRDEVYCDECRAKVTCDKDHEGKAELIIAKQRNGPTGPVHLRWRSQFSRFESREGVQS